jgi:hypothetical protein
MEVPTNKRLSEAIGIARRNVREVSLWSYSVALPRSVTLRGGKGSDQRFPLVLKVLGRGGALWPERGLFGVTRRGTSPSGREWELTEAENGVGPVAGTCRDQDQVQGSARGRPPGKSVSGTPAWHAVRLLTEYILGVVKASP